MTREAASKLWSSLLELFEEKLQYSILEQAKSVIDVRYEGSELLLTVATDEACEFFNSPVNERRIIILGRPVVQLEKISATKADAEPLR